MLDDELLELSGQLPVSANGEVRLDPLLDCGEPDLLEPLDRGLREGVVGEVGEWCSAPEGECLAEEIGGDVRFSSRKCLACFFSQTLEDVEVELLE
jgi:hypothetical protein